MRSQWAGYNLPRCIASMEHFWAALPGDFPILDHTVFNAWNWTWWKASFRENLTRSLFFHGENHGFQSRFSFQHPSTNLVIHFLRYNVGPPSYASWFINPMNTIVICVSWTIVIEVLNQLSYHQSHYNKTIIFPYVPYIFPGWIT